MIAHVRIDERLLHGQVAVKWVSYTKSTDVVIVDDQVANSPMQKKMFLAMSPQGKSVYVCTTAEAIEMLTSEEFTAPARRVFVVAKLPSVILALKNAGVDFNALNIGNLSGKGSRRQVYRFFFADETEKAQLKELLSQGVSVYYQEIPDMKPKDLEKLLK